MFKQLGLFLGSNVDEKFTNSLYGQLCNFVHTNMPAIASLMDDNLTQTTEDGYKIVYLSTPSRYDKVKVDGVAYLPIITLLVMRKIFNELHVEMQSKIDFICAKVAIALAVEQFKDFSK